MERVTVADDPELEIDYVTAKLEHLPGIAPESRLCTFTLRSKRRRSHYFTLLMPPVTDYLKDELELYIMEHMAYAVHTRTCNVR